MPEPPTPHRYLSSDEDSGRWLDFGFREGDIVISTRSKSGTTWMQMICALLVFGTPDLPDRLATLSPWLDWLVVPKEDAFATLEAQQHRRFIKTHTPLDGVPLEPGVTYIVVARHPLDMAVSLYHQGANLDRQRMAELSGQPFVARGPRPPVDDWLRSWVESDADPREELDSLPGVMWHLSDAWARRHDENVVLVHYDDLRRDLAGQMRRLAAQLHIDVPEEAWPRLVEAATFEQMSSRATDLAPDPSGVMKSHQAFFRAGSSGGGRALLTPAEEERYLQRAAELAPADLLAWLHRPPV
ncbi:MAG TPA: sulfotransferase domain-containing protein [Nocardioidaceae bacterium]|nr:sulfotransferase domain-containing protein [Nocardioidaceae bacterium]